MVATSLIVHEDRGCRVFKHFGSCLGTGYGQTTLCIVDNEFFAKGIDEELRAPCDDKLVGVGACEAYGIANHVAPQSARRAYQHGIVASRLHSPQGQYRGIGTLDFVHGDKLVEYAVVKHQAHRGVRRIVLYAKEAFTRIVCLHIVHCFRGYQTPVLLAVWCEGYAAMEEYFQIGPYFEEIVLACNLKHTVHHREHPRGYSAEIRYVAPHGFACYAVALCLEVRE